MKELSQFLVQKTMMKVHLSITYELTIALISSCLLNAMVRPVVTRHDSKTICDVIALCKPENSSLTTEYYIVKR